MLITSAPPRALRYRSLLISTRGRSADLWPASSLSLSLSFYFREREGGKVLPDRIHDGERWMRVVTYIFGTRLFQFSGITLFWNTVFLVFEEDFERSGQSFFFSFSFSSYETFNFNWTFNKFQQGVEIGKKLFIYFFLYTIIYILLYTIFYILKFRYCKVNNKSIREIFCSKE